MCSIITEIDKSGDLSLESVSYFVDAEIDGYEEPFSGGKEKLRKALQVMMLAHISSNIKLQAENLLKDCLSE